jgi:peptide/nickel transport system substrate-binding protein
MQGSRAGRALMISLGVALLVLGAASARPLHAGRYGGTLVVGIANGLPVSLDPTEANSSAAIEVFETMCQRLYQTVSNHGVIEHVPMLAAALPTVSKDKLTYTVKLRQGILFNDGTPLNAQAVVTSIQRMINDPLSTRKSDYADVASVAPAGQYTVVFHMKARDSVLVGNYSFIMSPTALAREGTSFPADPVCVGPFMFDHRDPTEVTVIKSPWYYGKDSIHLDKIVYVSASDGPSAAAALEAGSIQAIDNVDPTQLGGVEQTAGLHVLGGPGLGYEGILFNIGNSRGVGNLPYARNVGTDLSSSPLLRQAFEEAIDRNTVNRVVFGGFYQVTCTPIPPANSEWYPVIKAPCAPFDPAGARRLVSQSGIASPTVDLIVGSSPSGQRLGQVVQAEEKAVGINVVIDTGGTSGRIASGNFDAVVNGFEPGSDGDPNYIISQQFASWGSRNFAGYSNPRLDYVLANGLKATQPAARAVNYRVAQQILLADRPEIFLYDIVYHAAYSTSLTGMRLIPNGLLDVEYAQYR